MSKELEYLRSRDDITEYGSFGKIVENHTIFELAKILEEYSKKRGENKIELPNIYTVLKKIDFDTKCEEVELSMLRGVDARQVLFGLVQSFYDEISKQQL